MNVNGKEFNEKLLHLLNLSDNDDKEAFTKFAQNISKRIFYIAFNILNDRMYAEDVLNSVLLKTWQNSKKILKLKNPIGYINTIAYNASIDIKRKKTELPLYDNIPYPEYDNNTKMDIKKALDNLNDEEREITLYHIHAGYSFQKIAYLLGLSKKAVYLRYLKATEKLRKYLYEKQ